VEDLIMSRTTLAHIEKIIKIYPIESADKIEMCQVLDFHVVVKKGEFKTGDSVVYIEVDSILPDGLSADLKASYDILKKELKKATGKRIQEIEKELKKATGERIQEIEKEISKIEKEISEIEKEISKIISKNTRPEFEFLRQKKFTIKALKYNFDNGFGGNIISNGLVMPLSILPNDIQISEGLDVTKILGIEKVVEDPNEIVLEKSSEISLLEKFLDNKFSKYKFYRNLKKKFKGTKLKGSWDN
jgi:hypothetical protein